MLSDDLGQAEARAGCEALLAQLKEDRAGASSHLFIHSRLQRFLQANAGSTSEALAHFRRMLEWRAEHGMDALRVQLEGLPWNQESVTLTCPGFLEMMSTDATEFSPEHHLLWVQRDGRLQLDRIMAISDERLFGAFNKLVELRQFHLDRWSEQQGRLIKVVQVRDLSGLSITRIVRDALVMKRLSRILKSLNTAYPECLYKLVLLNLPGAFNLLWAALSPLLNERIRSKVHFLAGGPFDFPRELLALCGPRVLPALARAAREEKEDERKLGPGHASFACCEVPAGYASTWLFKVSPPAATLRFSVLFIELGSDDTIHLTEEVVAPSLVRQTVSGSFAPPEGGRGLLWLTWHNETWVQEQRLSSLQLRALPQDRAQPQHPAPKPSRSRHQLPVCGCFPWFSLGSYADLPTPATTEAPGRALRSPVKQSPLGSSLANGGDAPAAAPKPTFITVAWVLAIIVVWYAFAIHRGDS
eukprot:TRINITY_DN58567_c0_g1_i1.p1 TRINITY_DN58567_c0_g1~~TRINITY_DN58567_c0_g1_i1.p1  ORF type:complete len:490 (+),score=64.41 TRINITY_DN58567_c0_g1_i1:57-1472(+)